MQLQSELNILQSYLEKLNLRALEHLRPGTFPQLLEGIFKDYGITKLPDTIEVLFLWHDGTNIKEDFIPIENSIFPYFVFLSSEFIHSLFHSKEDYFFEFKRKKLLPLFLSGNDDFLVVSIEELRKKNESRVYLVSIEYPEFNNFISIYDSLKTMFYTVNKCYSENFYYVNVEDELDKEYDASFELSAHLNPLSDFWKQMT